MFEFNAITTNNIYVNQLYYNFKNIYQPKEDKNFIVIKQPNTFYGFKNKVNENV